MPQPGPGTDSGPPRTVTRSPGWPSIVWTCAFGVATIVALLIEGTDGNVKWVLIGLGVASVLIGLTVAVISILRQMGVQFDTVVDAVYRRWRWWVAGGAILVFLLTLILVVPDGKDTGCPDPVQVSVLVPVDGAADFAAIVQRFADGYRDDDGCLKADITAFSAGWPESRDALARHWESDPDGDLYPLRDLGPRPDLWISESVTQLREVRSQTHDAGPFGGDGHTVGWTPLVLAVPAAGEAQPADAARQDEPIQALLSAIADTGAPTRRPRTPRCCTPGACTGTATAAASTSPGRSSSSWPPGWRTAACPSAATRICCAATETPTAGPRC